MKVAPFPCLFLQIVLDFCNFQMSEQGKHLYLYVNLARIFRKGNIFSFIETAPF